MPFNENVSVEKNNNKKIQKNTKKYKIKLIVIKMNI